MYSRKTRPDCLQVPVLRIGLRDYFWVRSAPFVEPDPLERVSGAKFGRKPAKNQIQIIIFIGFGTVSGRNWPRDPFQRVGLNKWCRTHPKLAPETNSNAVS